MIDEYLKAQKSAEKESKARANAGEYPFLPAADDLLPDFDLMTKKPLGIMEIPTSMIVGTKTRARQNSFGPNFMPLLDASTEFAAKWSTLYMIQMGEGFNDPIKVYEYLHRFYVQEGNKRVSVSKYLGTPAISADVTRVMPSDRVLSDNPSYAEFLKFYAVTGLYNLEFSWVGAYSEVAELLGEDLEHRWPEEKITSLKSVYWRFGEVYKELQSKEGVLAAGDAFVVYLRIYVDDALGHYTSKVMEKRIDRIQKELLTELSRDRVELVEEAEDALSAGNIIEKTGKTISKVIPALSYTSKHPLKAAFIYEKMIDSSSWTADHDKGRMRLEKTYGGTVVTRYFENCGDTESFERAAAEADRWGADVIFTTSVSQIDDTLRAAIKYKNIKFLNCSVNQSKQAVRNYYAKIYEAKFLAGVIAGIYSSADGTHRIGYCSDSPVYGTIAGINAFAIGAAMTDPSVKIYLDWVSRADNNWWWETLDSGIHVMSAVDSMHNSDGSDAHGLCFVERCEPGTGNDLSGSCRITNLATPIWKWGKLYEIIVKTILDGTYSSRDIEKKDRATNYWWGMISGVVDIELSDELPMYTRQLVNLLRSDIINGSFNPFDGELRSQEGIVKKEDDAALTSLDIIEMDWLNENIIGEIPVIDNLKDEAKTAVKVGGVDKSRPTVSGVNRKRPESRLEGKGNKVLLIADREERSLWGDWSDYTRERLSDVGLILSAGDLDPDYLEFLVTMLNVPLVYVRGNHDGRYDEKPPEGCINADGKIVEAAGLRILGLGGSMRYKRGAPDMYTETEMKRRIRSIQWRALADRLSGRDGFDILLTHEPCRGYGDMEDIAHTGFECFNDLLKRYSPRFHCFGHVHEEYGRFQRLREHPSGTLLINACGHYIFEF